ncbi:hypothetical protein [Desulfosporosinus youngiae]|uniref:Uncharacterized protein n=1 Tax=Desulfosporosinus youngiae DSM 17734 TaxID=768710 RepID=H5Y236_9FIRM|nr:hypothetical protein [Desulfosporosinus youngiae]EHQ88234.1 hypothetical protein DesyoDRAFT_1063 [Desulfosporosinus youngiae DSM 17734]
MDERFRDCPKECPLEDAVNEAREKACEIIRKLEAEKDRLKLQLENLKTACKETAEILGDMVDVANATGSAYLYRRDTENVLRVIKALMPDESEVKP